jgi:hypothetical protein
MPKTLSIALAVAVATATPATVRHPTQAVTPSALRWGPCPADVASPTLECSTVQDWVTRRPREPCLARVPAPRRSGPVRRDRVRSARCRPQCAQRRFGRGLEDRFADFAKFAAANPQYGLGTTPKQVRAKFFDLARRLEKTPVQGINGSLFRSLRFQGLCSDGGIPGLIDAGMPLVAAQWKALDTSQPLPADPPPANVDDLISSRLHVMCGDTRWPRSARTYQRAVAVDRVRHPLIGAAAADIDPCAFRPAPVERPVHIGDRGPSNVLMVQNLRDPGTPLAGARQLRQAFGDRARMVTVDEGGHGAYLLFATNTCANDTVTAFLTTGQRPGHDLTCAAESR